MTVKEEPVLGSLPPAELLFVAPGTDTAKYVLPTWRKYTILFVISWMALVITWSTSSLFVATDEISAQFHTTPTVLNIMNACMLLLMGFSSLVWVPLGRIWGRERVYTGAIVTLLATSIGMALAPNMAVFTLMRLLGGVPGTYFMVAGQTILADIFEPVRIHSPPTRNCIECNESGTYSLVNIDYQGSSQWLLHDGLSLRSRSR